MQLRGSGSCDGEGTHCVCPHDMLCTALPPSLLTRMNNALVQAVLDQEMDRGWTALAIACKNGDLLSVTTLLKARASVDSTDRSVPSPLLRAASSNFHQVASALLSAKAFVNKPNAQGVTPLFLVRGSRICSALPPLLSFCSWKVRFHAVSHTVTLQAASRGNSESLRILLQHGAATDQEHSTTGITPLMQASAFKHIQCAQFLLQSKACPNKVAKNSMTALHLAIKNKNPAGISVLMRFKVRGRAPVSADGRCSFICCCAHDRRMQIAHFLRLGPAGCLPPCLLALCMNLQRAS